MKKVKKAVIPVAGMGTRFLPITKSVAKEMLPIVDKPTISYIVEECVNSGIEEILFITSSYKKSIEDYFDKSFELEERLKNNKSKLKALHSVSDLTENIKMYFIRQGEPMGSGHAVSLAKSFVGDEPFALLYGDDIIYSDNKPALKQLIELYEETSGSNIIGVQEVKKEEVSKYGIVDFSEGNKIKTIVEKPKVEEAPSTCAGLGRYIINPTVFDILDNLAVDNKSGEYQFTDAMKILMGKEDFYGCKYDGKYYDTGSKIGYLIANIEYGLRHNDTKDLLRDYLKNIDLD